MSTSNTQATKKTPAHRGVETMPEGVRVFARIYRTCLCLLLSIAAAAATAQRPGPQTASASRAENAPANAPQPTPPPYHVNRQDEDWSMMRDPARRRDWSDELKYIPLGRREAWYVSIGGEARPFYERYRNEQWGNAQHGIGKHGFVNCSRRVCKPKLKVRQLHETEARMVEAAGA